jgi:hypothetical protein
MSRLEPERGLERTKSARGNFNRSPERKLTRAKSDRKMLEPERGLKRTVSERRTKRDTSRERLNDWLE